MRDYNVMLALLGISNEAICLFYAENANGDRCSQKFPAALWLKPFAIKVHTIFTFVAR